MGLPASRLSHVFPVESFVGVYGKCSPQDSNLQPRDSRARTVDPSNAGEILSATGIIA